MTTDEVKATIEYDFINEYLEYGQRQELAAKHKLHRNTVYRILNKEFINRPILEDAQKMAVENANKILAMKEQVRLLKEKLNI